MTLLKDPKYKDINISLLSLESDIKRKLQLFDTTTIKAQLEEINKRIDEINVSSGNSNSGSSINNSSEIDAIKTDIENINTEINTINSNIDNIEQQLSNVFSAENFVEDFNTATEPGIYAWSDSAANRPANYGVLLVNRLKTTSDWINQTAYSTNGKIYFRQKINDGEWTSWRALAYEDITKTYTIPDVTTPTTRYIKLGTFPWNFSEKVKAVLSGANFADTVEFNVLGGNGGDANVNGWYTTNSGSTQAILVVPVAPVSFASNIEVWLKVAQYTTLTVTLTGSAKAAQYFNSNPQMNNTVTSPTGSKTVAPFNLKRGYFGYNENSLNCYETNMVSLGFTKDQVVSLVDFAQAVVNYTGTNKGQVYFTWLDDNKAYIVATAPYNTQLEINGGMLTFQSRYLDVDSAWNTFEAEYINRAGQVFSFGYQTTGSTASYSVRKLVDSNDAKALRTNADAGYLCKLYSGLTSSTSDSTSQAYNVILLGKIPDPASTAAPASPYASWDIDVDFYFVRSKGHKASWCNVKAGYGYSNAWRKYGSIETFGVDMDTSYNNPFYLVTLKYNNEWYIAVKQFMGIDGNYSARVHNVNIEGGRNPSSVVNTGLANMLKVVPYLKTNGTILNSEINSSIANFSSTYAPTIERNSSLVLTNDGTANLSGYGKETLSIGSSSGLNLGIDKDDIQARNNAAASALYLNYYGGMVRVNAQGLANGGLQVGGHLNIPTSAPTNPVRGDIWLVL